MYTPRAISLQRSIDLGTRTYVIPRIEKRLTHKERVAQELRRVGVWKGVMWRSECRYLHHIIHDEEHVMAAVHGKHTDGYALLVATDKRIIFLDKKPFFVNEDELTYDIVSGVKLTTNGIGQTLTLHSKLGDIVFHTLNGICAYGFVSFIEKRRLERSMFQTVTYKQPA